jgi:hypothetical protein
MKKINEAISDLVVQTQTEGQDLHAPTLWEIAAEYPAMVRVISDPAAPNKSFAEVKVPYSSNAVQLLRACKGARWVPALKLWRVPAYSARRLSEAMFSISQRSRR